jgi:SPP1 gp7 family putative phage head morphogenesis protein
MTLRSFLNFLFAKRSSIVEVMERQREAVLKREADAVRRLIRGYAPIEKLFRKRLARIESMIEEAIARNDEPGYLLFEQARYKILIDELKAEVERYSVFAEEQTKSFQKRSADLGAKHATEMLRAEVQVRRAFTALNTGAIESMVGVLADGSPLNSLFRTFGLSVPDTARDILLGGIGSGDNPRVIAKRLDESIKKLSRDRALRIARNESLRVLTTSQMRTYEANPDVVTGVRIVSALDSRTCPLCWARHGKIMKLGEPFYRHVTCRCALAPVTSFSRKWATGEQEFATLSEAEQRKILGPQNYAYWSKGQITFDDLYSLQRDAKWGPKLLVNNHMVIKKLIRAEGTYPAASLDDAVSVRKERDRRNIASK